MSIHVIPYTVAAHDAARKLRDAAMKLAEAQQGLLDAANTLDMFEHNLRLAQERSDRPGDFQTWTGSPFDELIRAAEALSKRNETRP